MKNHLLFTVFGGLLLFFWQFFSYAASGMHDQSQAYTEKQDTILAFFKAIDLQPGRYLMPRPPEEATPEEGEALVTSFVGKPWALVDYKPDFKDNMGKNMARGLSVDLVIAFLLFLVLSRLQSPSTGMLIGISTALGWMGFLTETYTNFIWYAEPGILASFIDSILPWAALGWLASRFLKAGQ